MIFYVCGVMYQLKYIEEKDAECIERSNMLLQRAITLLYQNEEKQINEVTILNQIAQNYLLLEKTEQALESLKENNVIGIISATAAFYPVVNVKEFPSQEVCFEGYPYF